MLGNLHVRFGVGVGVQLPGLHHATTGSEPSTVLWPTPNTSRTRCFPGSTTSRRPTAIGAHGYFVLRKAGISPEEVNILLGRLQAFLRETTTAGFDIETVEIKGRCPVIVWGRRRGEVTNYKAGVLAKIPRNAERFDELKATTTLTIQQLRVMVCQEVIPAVNRIISIPAPRVVPPTGKSTTVSKQVSTCPAATTNVCIPVVREKVAAGSCSDRVISEAELEKLSGHYRTVATTLMGVHPIKTGRVAATADDLAIFLMFLKWFTAHMNEDGSLPWKRFKGLWDALFKAADIDRAFDPKRFAALRNYLSSLGLLDWKDSTYHLGHWSNGVKVSGKACAWKASEQLLEMLTCDIGEKESGEETSHLLQIIESLELLPFEHTLRPIWTIPMPLRAPTTAELEHAMGWAA